VGSEPSKGQPAAPGGGDRSAASRPLLATLVVLTFVSGLVDAISYVGLGHVFTANMTGNVAVIGFAIAQAPGFSAPRSLVSLGVFLVGSVCAGRLERAFEGRARAPWVRTALATEAALLAVAAALAFAGVGGGGRSYVLIAVMALAMGLRNGTVRRIGVPDLTTTVLTMTLTGLASDSSLAGGDNPRAGRRLMSVVALFAGATVGALLVLHDGLGWPLLVGTALVAATLPLGMTA
jgi:uncharacterized membrane protein YoaK (UPF0700 family)